ncbi:type II toxin-antitoxin system VapB family antitoxin [Methylobacterium platani]|uniref:Transcription factor n=2 Tax=Methylobacterium platani TaxID=427683 RepID=A0A179SFD1_9HYPH|nr:type II toxin-antitoxin system VapB family antitoxin [Methylobacterium platani]KMO12658.1 hypothetical protein SQ03_23840 [Methylobacterium platani JCM 14648]OAS26548.1 hypothetical protein A5481_05730 [Methylobacterium platani]
MAKRLIIEDDEIVGIAERMARRLGTTPNDVVTRLLREAEPRAAAKISLTPAQQADYEALRALVKDVARFRQPGATSDHSEFYDENGLPV